MANATYDNLWQQAIGELSEQLHVEGVDDENDNAEQNEVILIIIISYYREYIHYYIVHLF